MNTENINVYGIISALSRSQQVLVHPLTPDHNQPRGGGSAMAVANPIVVGEKFNRLTILEDRGRGKNGRVVRVQCDCGRISEKLYSHVKAGNSRSCGCLLGEAKRAQSKVGGWKDRRTYCVWKSMRNRCRNPKFKGYEIYGGRGIYVCERWESFEVFARDMGPRPSSKHSLDRIDNDGPYSPGNCRWATPSEQVMNSRHGHLVAYNGICKNLMLWSREYGINFSTLANRLKRGWTVERALLTPAVDMRKTR